MYDPLVRFLSQRSAQYQRRARLRILGSGELTDAAVSIYQELGGPILRYTATSTLLSLASIVFVFDYVLPSLGVTNNPNSIAVQLGEAAFSIGMALAVGAPLLGIGVGFSSAFVTGLASDYMNGQMAKPLEHVKEARKLLPKIILLGIWQTLYASIWLILGLGCLAISAYFFGSSTDSSFLAGLVAFLAGLGLFLGSIAFPIVLARQILILPIVVIEKLGIRAAARRNRELMRQSKIHSSGYSHAGTISILTYLLVLFIWGGSYSVTGMINVQARIDEWLRGSAWHELASSTVKFLPLFVTLWTVIPVWCAAATLLYYERRTRVEGYDIEALAQDLSKHVKKNRFEL